MGQSAELPWRGRLAAPARQGHRGSVRWPEQPSGSRAGSGARPPPGGCQRVVPTTALPGVMWPVHSSAISTQGPWAQTAETAVSPLCRCQGVTCCSHGASLNRLEAGGSQRWKESPTLQCAN